MKTSMHKILRAELCKRIEQNPRYSMRAFAKSLDLNVGVLSGILNERRTLTAKTTALLCSKLGMSPLQKSQILLSILGKNYNEATPYERMELDEEIFRTISDWYHWAILQLVTTEQYLENINHSNSKWIAKQLQISETEAKLAIERLLKLGLLIKNKSGFFKRTQKSLTTANKHITTEALKKWQRQIREKAIYSLEHDPIELRSMTSMTMAIDPSKINEAKKIIDDFQEQIAKFLENGKKQKVYQLCISLYPLQVKEI